MREHARSSPTRPNPITWLRQSLSRRLAAPVFPDDEAKTYHASVLNFVLLTSTAAMVVLTLIDVTTAYPSPALIGLELFSLGVLVVAREAVRRGHVRVVSIAVVVFSLVSLTLANIIFGTVRGPSAAGYLLLIVAASLLFSERGLSVTVLASGLCVVGLLIAEANGLIGANVYSPEEVEWLVLLVWMAAAAGLSYWGLRTTRSALARAEQELAARRAAEAALVVAKEQAEAANRAKGTFLANMSHELRTPLNAILGFSDLITRDPNLTDVQHENLTIITRSGEHLLSLINDVLDMAKIDAGRLTLQEQDFDLHSLLIDLIELFRARAEAKGLTLILTQWPDVPQFVHGDESKLRQVLLNLLGNAVKFTTVGIVELSVQRSEDRLRFAVQDTGAGIAPADLVAIFEPFVQVGSGRAMSHGTGLGLPISRELVQLMGGALTASSAGIAGEGSRFEFDLPLAPVTGAETTGPLTPGRRAIGLAPGQPQVGMLVAEDHAESRKLLADLLTTLGFAVRTAENGAEAVAIWEAWQPHLIWMDMRMPVMDGHEATQRIKATAQGQQTVIVAVSASVLSGEHSAVLADGCDDFVGKPYREEEIVACLIKHLGVQMIYADAAPSAAATDALLAFDLTALPAGWVVQARQAVVAADAKQLLQLAADVEGSQPALAAALREWVDNFDYDAILGLVNETTAV